MLFPTEKIFNKQVRRSFAVRLLRRIFLEDWLLKSFALLITLGLWLGVTGLRAPTSARLQSVPLKARVPDNIEVTNISRQEVDLLVSGDQRKIDRIKKEDLTVSLDLMDAATSGERRLQITPENAAVDLPSGVALKEIQPNLIAVRLERIEEREISVKAETSGAPPENFEIYSQTVSPQKVRVRGAQSVVEALDFLPTEKINLENRTTDFIARQTPFDASNLKISILDTTYVDVAFRIGERRVERMFMIPVKGEKKPATVVLYGARSVLEAIKSANLQIEILKTDAGENVPRLIVPLELQDKVVIRKLTTK
ncbi:MAG: hypothetical protein H0U87_08955 [Acidobacteria bacterium]|nr:hypothetical protein [Acidobacteriota bacterium]